MGLPGHETVVDMSSLFSESDAMSDKWNGCQQQNLLVRIVESAQNGSMRKNSFATFFNKFHCSACAENEAMRDVLFLLCLWTYRLRN